MRLPLRRNRRRELVISRSLAAGGAFAPSPSGRLEWGWVSKLNLDSVGHSAVVNVKIAQRFVHSLARIFRFIP